VPMGGYLGGSLLLFTSELVSGPGLMKRKYISLVWNNADDVRTQSISAPSMFQPARSSPPHNSYRIRSTM
jgi:hypothetical protein